MIYKFISKTLANRLKSLLPQIIIENQSAFTSKRVITDNVLVAFKLMHYLNYLNHKTSNKDSFMVTTLDKSKAFDKVKWGFIQRIMERLGFNARWINIIMQCISSVYYSVLINDVANGNIIPTRVLHQGDPFFSSLFLFCAKGFFPLVH